MGVAQTENLGRNSIVGLFSGDYSRDLIFISDKLDLIFISGWTRRWWRPRREGIKRRSWQTRSTWCSWSAWCCGWTWAPGTQGTARTSCELDVLPATVALLCSIISSLVPRPSVWSGNETTLYLVSFPVPYYSLGM